MSESDAEVEIEEIIGERSSSRKGLEYLVKWKNFDSDHNSWEPLKNLSNAVQAIADFHTKTAGALISQQKKSSTKKKSRSRSSSRSSRSPSRSRSRSQGRKKASPARKSRTTTTTRSVKTPQVEETQTETVTKSPGRVEKSLETVTKTVYSPEREQTSRVSRVTEMRTSTVSTSRPIALTTSTSSDKGCRWMNYLCAPVRKVQDCCGGLVRSDYPAIIVFTTISVIVLSYLLERNVNFENVWKSISGFFVAIWTWLTSLLKKD